MSPKNVVNMIIWWGGLIAHGVWYSRKYPDAGFWDQLTDLWTWGVIFGLMLLQLLVGWLFFRKR